MPAPSVPRLGGAQYVLRFISGKYKGGEFPVSNEKEIVVGRSSDLDMVLVEDMVSRKHARIAMQGDQIWIEDLGSTNGTFVNGEKIKRGRLKEGDRVLIGTSILKLLTADASRAAQAAGEAKRELESVAQARRASQQRTMSGSIEEVPLPDLLQLFGTSKKSGVLVVRTDRQVGRIYLKKGNIAYACIDDLDEMGATKALYRMLTWPQGMFDLEPAADPPEDMNVGVQELLIEGMRQLDEYNRLRDQLPEPDAHVVLCTPLNAPLRDLKPEDLDVLQLVHNYGVFETVLNKSEATDLIVAEILLRLKDSYIAFE
jgi:hypothetical protein